MSRKTRKTVIQAKLEASYGVSPGSFTAADNLLISTPRLSIDQTTRNRDLVRGYFGASEEIIAANATKIEFDIELAGSGTAGTAPAWGLLMRGCGMSETVSAGTSVSYAPVTDGQESLTLRYFMDGVLYEVCGARGTAKLSMPAYDIPKAHFSFTGLGAAVSASNADRSGFSTWQTPLPIKDANSSAVKIGGTLSGSTWTGGTTLAARSFEVDLGNTVDHMMFVNGERVDITARATTGQLAVALEAADEVQWYADLDAGTLSPFNFIHGGASGNILGLWGLNVQRVNPQTTDYQGDMIYQTDLRFLPDDSATGDDELALVVR